MTEVQAAGRGDAVAVEPPKVGAGLNSSATSTPPTAPSTTPSSSMAAEDPLLSLTPDEILMVLRNSDAISSSAANQHASAITRGIREASATERALGLRAAAVASKARTWCAELLEWSWPNSFAAADYSTKKAYEGTSTEGSIPAAIVAQREERIETIRDELETLNIDELKEYVRTVYILPSSRAGSMYEFDLSAPSVANHLDDFTALLTGMILSTLPYIHRLNRLLRLWSVRLLVLHQVPAFLESLWSSRTAVDSAWNAIRPEAATPEEKPELSRQAFETMQAVLGPRVSHLATVIDSMLDALEGHVDTLPDEWIDLMEAVQADYEEWVILAQKLADENETQKSKQIPKRDEPTEKQSIPTSIYHDARNAEIPMDFSAQAKEIEIDRNDITPTPLRQAHKYVEASRAAAAAAAAPPLLPPRSPMRDPTAFMMQERNALPSNSRVGEQIAGFATSHPASFATARQQAGADESFEPPRTPRRVPAPLLMPGRDERSVGSSRESSPPHSATSSSFASDISEPQIMEASPVQLTPLSPTRDGMTGFFSRRDSEHTDRGSVTVRGSVDLGEKRDSLQFGPTIGRAASPTDSPVQPRVRNIIIKRHNSDASASNEPAPIPEEPEHPSMLEDEYDEDSGTESEPEPEPRTLEEQLANRIRSILTNIPGRIHFASSQGRDPNDPKQRSVSGQSRSASGYTIPPLPNKQTAAAITLAPAFEKRTTPRMQSGNSEIKVYHLIQAEKEKPIKLYVRLVGDEERVMVRVGGGWADLGDYLKEYAVHHGGRTVSGAKPEPRVVADSQHLPYSYAGNGNGAFTSEASEQHGSSPNGRPGALAHHKVRGPGGLGNSPRTPEGMLRRGDALLPGNVDSVEMRRSVTGGSTSGAEDPSIGLGGVKRNIELSPKKQAWVEGMIHQASRQASGESKKRSEFVDLGKAGSTRRFFWKGKAGDE